MESSQRSAARAVARAFSFPRPEVRRYYDETESSSVDIAAAGDRPAVGYTSFSSLNLHLAANLLDGRNVPAELAGVAHSSCSWFPNLLATAAFHVAKDGWLAAPGVVFPSLVSSYDPTTALPHVMWSLPFPWDELSSLALDDGSAVHWLLAVPISDPERQFLETRGFNEFESLFARRDVPYYDVTRASIV